MSQGKVLAISAIVILGACGGTTGSPPDSGTPDSGTPDVGDAGIVTRTVSSTLQTIYLLDDGTSVTRPGWNATLAFPDATVAALVYADATEASGYKVVPVTVGADSSFSVAGVPEGPYFLELDSSFGTNDQNGVGVVLKERALIEMTTSTPDLSVVVAARPEATFAMQPTPVQFQLSGVTPFVRGDAIKAASTDNQLNATFTFFTPSVDVGATSIDAGVEWEAEGLPVQAKSDVTWVFQRGPEPLPDGGTLIDSKAFARVTDFTVVDGRPATLKAALAAPPQGSVHADLRWSQFAALGVHPGATPAADAFSPPALLLGATPISVDYPKTPISVLPNQAAFIIEAEVESPKAPGTDVDYGTVTYGQPLSAPWVQNALVVYTYDVPLKDSAGATVTQINAGSYNSFVARDLLAIPLVPQISPPVAPMVNGKDAYAFQGGVGLQPSFSWSAPSLGTANKYALTLVPRNVAEGDTQVDLFLYDRTEVKLPPGLLETGKSYVGSITAYSSPDRLDDPPLRTGSPTHQVNTVFGLFTP